MIPESNIWSAMPSTGFVAAYVRYAMQRTDAPAVFHIPVALSILANVAPRSLRLPWAPKYMLANFYSILVGPSGDGKTSAIDVGIDVLRDAISTGPDGSKMAALIGSEPGSEEGLHGMLVTESRRLVAYREFGHFLQQTDQSTSYAHKLRGTYMRLYDDAGPWAPEYRQKRPPALNIRLSLTGGVTPADLGRYTSPSDWDRGFIGRFCVIAGKQERRVAIPSAAYDQQHAAIAGHLRSLAGHPEDTTGFCRARQFDDAAEAMWTRWYNDDLRDIAASLPERVRAAVKRMQNVALKAALLYAFDCGIARPGKGKAWVLTSDVLRPAIRLAEMHLESIRYTLDHVAEDQDMRARQTVLRAIEEGAQTLGEILAQARMVPRRVREMIEMLEIEQAIRKSGKGGQDRWIAMHAVGLPQVQAHDQVVESVPPQNITAILPPVDDDAALQRPRLELLPEYRKVIPRPLPKRNGSG